MSKVCPDCGAVHGRLFSSENRCFDCENVRNPFTSIGASIDVGPQDSTEPSRVRDGTAAFNVGLPGVETVIGRRPDGKPRLSYRPIANNELGTTRNRNEYAKRHGLITMDPKGSKKAVG